MQHPYSTVSTFIGRFYKKKCVKQIFIFTESALFCRHQHNLKKNTLSFSDNK